MLVNREPALLNFNVLNMYEFVYPPPIVMANLTKLVESITGGGDVNRLDAAVCENDASNEFYSIGIGVMRTTVTRENLLAWYQNRYGEEPVFFRTAADAQ